MDIKFYIPESETIPTDLTLYADDVYVRYERIHKGCGYVFYVLLDDEKEAIAIVKEIVDRMIREHDELQHGVSWRTVSLSIVPQEERYKIGTIVEWKYRVRDSY